MLELDLPGYELTDLPQDSQTVSRAWIEHYHHGQPLNQIQIQSLVKQASNHQQLLQKVITNY
jgi:hypothetical protein